MSTGKFGKISSRFSSTSENSLELFFQIPLKILFEVLKSTLENLKFSSENGQLKYHTNILNNDI